MKTFKVGDRCRFSYYSGTVIFIHKKQIIFEIDGASECLILYENSLTKLKPKAKRRRVFVKFMSDGKAWNVYDEPNFDTIEFIEVRK